MNDNKDKKGWLQQEDGETRSEPLMPKTHPSFGLARFSRQQHGGTGRHMRGAKLFASDVGCPTVINLSIDTARYDHDHHQQKIYSDERVISVSMSPAQFAELLTSLNIGEGVPCTIEWVRDTGKIEDPPGVTFMERTQEDLQKEGKKLGRRVREFTKILDAELDGSKISKKSKTAVMGAARMILQEIESNIPFYQECVMESVADVVAQAKAQISEAVLHAQIVLGKEAANKLGEAGEAPFTMLEEAILTEEDCSETDNG